MTGEALGLGLSVLALTLGGILKGATGMGVPLISLPVIAGFYGVPSAIAVMIAPMIVTNIWQIWQFRKARAGREALWRMLFGAAGGVLIGTMLLTILSEPVLAVLLAAISIGYLVLRLVHPDMVLRPEPARRAAFPVGVVAGAMQGSVGISAPVGVTFVHAQRLPREAHVFAVSAMFLVFGGVQAVSLTTVGILTGRLALIGVAAIVPICAGMWAGTLIGRRLDQRAFDAIILAVVTISALILLARALPDLIG